MPTSTHTLTTPLPHLRTAPQPGPASRLLARLRRFPLDQQLADGADPAQGAQLAARAVWLARPATRALIARSLERLAHADELHPGRWGVTPSRPAAQENREQLLALADLLRSDRRLYVRGVAQLELVVIDGTGPAYRDRRGEALARQLELARVALAG